MDQMNFTKYNTSMYSLKKCVDEKYKWQKTVKVESKAPVWSKLMEELLDAEIPAFRNLSADRKAPEFDPNILMDLRHKQIRAPGNQKQTCCKHSIIADARRLIRKERLEKLRNEQEIKNVNKEIEDFKIWLQKQREEDTTSKDSRKKSNPHYSTPDILAVTCNNDNVNVKNEESFVTYVQKYNSGATETIDCKDKPLQVNHKQNEDYFAPEIVEHKVMSQNEQKMKKVDKDIEDFKIWLQKQITEDITSEVSCNKSNPRYSTADILAVTGNNDDVNVKNEDSVVTYVQKFNFKVTEAVDLGCKEKLLEVNHKQNEYYAVPEILDRNVMPHKTKNQPLNDMDYEEWKKNVLQLKISDKSDVSVKSTDLCLLRCYWNKWLNYIHHQRLLKQLQFRNTVSVSFQYETKDYVKKILGKYWKMWQKVVLHNKEVKILQAASKEKVNNINRFLKRIHNKKSDIIKKKHELNSVNKEESVKRYRINDNSRRSVRKNTTKIIPVMNESNEHQLKSLKSIVSHQRRMLIEKNKEINELKLMSDVQKSEAEIKKELKEIISNCNDVNLKIKGEILKGQTYSFSEYSKLAANMAPHPIILKMEERQKERKEKWETIQQRKNLIEKERQEKIEQLENERKMKEHAIKMQKIEEIKMKRKMEKEILMKKQMEREKMRRNLKKASDYYKNYLLRRYGLAPFVKLLKMRAEQCRFAEQFREKKVIARCLFSWNLYTKEQIKLKINRASQHYDRQLLSKSLNCWIKFHQDCLRKYQVAVDMYDMKLVQHTFVSWHQWITFVHLERSYIMQYAQCHYTRKLLVNTFKAWCRLPLVLKKERELEERKDVWRKKVREIIPDFCPNHDDNDVD